MKASLALVHGGVAVDLNPKMTVPRTVLHHPAEVVGMLDKDGHVIISVRTTRSIAHVTSRDAGLITPCLFCAQSPVGVASPPPGFFTDTEDEEDEAEAAARAAADAARRAKEAEFLRRATTPPRARRPTVPQ
jgi:hypothetical protein